MFINSANPYQPNCAFKGELKPEVMKKQCEKFCQVIINPERGFRLPESEAEKKQALGIIKKLYQIMLTQDIWNPSLQVKMPVTQEEKEALLEILGFRAQLDRFTQLSQRKFEVMHDETISTDKRNNDLNAINKKIDEEKKRHKGAISFFEEINKIEEDYIDNKYIKLSALEKFWHQSRKNNINPNGNLSTRNIIDLISTEKKNEVNTDSVTLQKTEAKTKETSIRGKVVNIYENYLQQCIDVYSEDPNSTARNTAIARKLTLAEAEKELFKKHRGLKALMPEIFEEAEIRYKENVELAASKEMYPVGHIWQIMDKIEKHAKEAIKELKECEAVLKEKPENKKAAKTADYLRKKLNSLKNEWLDGLTQSVQYEKENRERAISAGPEIVKAYDYLVEKNANVIGQKSIFETLQSNYNDIYDAPWTEIFSVFL